MLEILNLKVVILLEYESIKIFFQKFTIQIGLKKLLWLKVESNAPSTYVVSDFKSKGILGTFYEKELRLKK